MIHSKARPAFVFLTIFLDTMGCGLILPVLPLLLQQITDTSAAGAAPIYGIVLSTYSVATFLCAPLVGRCSDHYGRRKTILVCLAAAAINYVIIADANTVWLLIVARTVAGATGSTVGAAFAYLADVTPEEGRSRAYSFMNAAASAGFVFGPVLGGLLVHVGPRAPFWVAAALTGANFVYGLFFVPESLAVEKRAKLSLAGLMPFALFGKRPPILDLIRDSAVLRRMILAALTYQLAATLPIAAWFFFLEIQLHWSPAQIGTSLALMGVSSLVVQGAVAPFLIPKMGDRWAVLGGIALTTICTMAYTAVHHGWQVYALIAVSAFGMIAGPASLAIISKLIPPALRGEVFGFDTSLQSVIAIFGLPLGAWVYGLFTNSPQALYFPGGIFAVAAGIFVITLALEARALLGSQAMGELSKLAALPESGASAG